MGFRKQVGKLECYYYSSKLHRAKMDVYGQTSVQLWHEQRTLTAAPRSRQPSTYSSTTNSGGRSIAVPLLEAHAQEMIKVHRTYSRGSVAARSATSRTSSSTSSSKGSHTIRTQEAKVEQIPESSKLVIFARPEKVKGGVGGVEILVMESQSHLSYQCVSPSREYQKSCSIY